MLHKCCIYIYVCITVYIYIFFSAHVFWGFIQIWPVFKWIYRWPTYSFGIVYTNISHLQVDSRWVMVSTILQLSPNHAMGKTQKKHVINGLLTRMWGYPQEFYLLFRRSWICPKTTLPKFATLLEHILLEKTNILNYVKQSSNI